VSGPMSKSDQATIRQLSLMVGGLAVLTLVLIFAGFEIYQHQPHETDPNESALIAERIAIETYSEIINWLGDGDITSRRLMEQILEKEEEHAEDMASLLAKTSK